MAGPPPPPPPGFRYRKSASGVGEIVPWDKEDLPDYITNGFVEKKIGGIGRRRGGPSEEIAVRVGSAAVLSIGTSLMVGMTLGQGALLFAVVCVLSLVLMVAHKLDPAYQAMHWRPRASQELPGPSEGVLDDSEFPTCEKCDRKRIEFALHDVVRYRGGKLEARRWCDDCIDEQLEKIKLSYVQDKVTLEQLQANLDLFLLGEKGETYKELKTLDKSVASKLLGLKKTLEEAKAAREKVIAEHLETQKQQSLIMPTIMKVKDYMSGGAVPGDGQPAMVPMMPRGAYANKVTKEFIYPKDAKTTLDLVEKNAQPAKGYMCSRCQGQGKLPKKIGSTLSGACYVCNGSGWVDALTAQSSAYVGSIGRIGVTGATGPTGVAAYAVSELWVDRGDQPGRAYFKETRSMSEWEYVHFLREKIETAESTRTRNHCREVLDRKLDALAQRYYPADLSFLEGTPPPRYDNLAPKITPEDARALVDMNVAKYRPSGGGDIPPPMPPMKIERPNRTNPSQKIKY